VKKRERQEKSAFVVGNIPLQSFPYFSAHKFNCHRKLPHCKSTLEEEKRKGKKDKEDNK